MASLLPSTPKKDLQNQVVLVGVGRLWSAHPEVLAWGRESLLLWDHLWLGKAWARLEGDRQTERDSGREKD